MEKIGPTSDRLLRYIYATRCIEEIAAHLNELGEEKVSEEIRGNASRLENDTKGIKRTLTKRRPIAIDLAKLSP